MNRYKLIGNDGNPPSVFLDDKGDWIKYSDILIDTLQETIKKLEQEVLNEKKLVEVFKQRNLMLIDDLRIEWSKFNAEKKKAMEDEK